MGPLERLNESLEFEWFRFWGLGASFDGSPKKKFVLVGVSTDLFPLGSMLGEPCGDFSLRLVDISLRLIFCSQNLPLVKAAPSVSPPSLSNRKISNFFSLPNGEAPLAKL